MLLKNNNNQISQFLDTVCLHIKWKEAHVHIRQELLDHITDLVEEFRQQGLSENEGVQKAVAQMGNAEDLGNQLDKVHKPRPDWGLFALVALLLGIGLATLYSLEVNGLLRGYSLFSKGLVFISMGLLMVLGTYYFDYRKILSFSWVLYFATASLGLITYLSGPTYNGARMFLDIGFLQINVISVSPILFNIALAGILYKMDWKNDKLLFNLLGLAAIPLVLYLKAPSLSSAVIFSAGFLVLLWLCKAPLARILLVSLVPGLIFIFSILQEPYRLKRITSFLNPYGDPQGAGWLQVQSLEAVKSAGLWGQGFNFPANTLPNLHTEMVFTYIVYTFGWMAGFCLLVLAISLLIRMAKVAKQINNQYGKLLISGITITFAVQFFWNILMTISVAPITGMPLPFLSYGGSQMLIDLVAVGLVLSIYRRKTLGTDLKNNI